MVKAAGSHRHNHNGSISFLLPPPTPTLSFSTTTTVVVLDWPNCYYCAEEHLQVNASVHVPLSDWVFECVSLCVQAFGTELNIVCCHTFVAGQTSLPSEWPNNQRRSMDVHVSILCVSSLSVYVQFRWNGEMEKEKRAGRVWLHWVYSFISRNKERKRIGTSAEWSSSKWTQNCSILTANCYNAAGAAEGTSKMHTEYNWLLHIQATVSCVNLWATKKIKIRK